MTEQQLFKQAEKFYFQEGKELRAIEAFKELLSNYPNNVDGWTHLATMQNKITDFDGAITSINRAIALKPKDYWIINQKCTILSLISRFPAEGQIYFDQQTREAHEIITYASKQHLLEDLIDALRKVLGLEDCKETDKYSHLWRLAFSLREIKEYRQAIDYLNQAIDFVPKRYDDKRRSRELANLHREMATNYTESGDYQNGINYLTRAFELGLDDFNRTMLFDIYKNQGYVEKAMEVLADLLKRIDKKFEAAPETAYIVQKVEVLKLQKNVVGLKTIVGLFEKLEPLSDYDKQIKSRLTTEIENYLQQCT
jgi:tetratricopeptide (TPR) repeat protein